MNRIYTYKAKLSPTTHRNLIAFLRQQKQLWNAALEERQKAWENENKITYFHQQASLKELRQEPEYNKFDATAQRTSIRRLDKAFQNFFRRIKKGQKPGYPRFKSQVRSFETSQFRIYEGKHNTVNIKGIGQFSFKGEISGKVKVLRVVRSPLRVKIQLVCELPDTNKQDTRPAIGIDMGITNRITLSNRVQLPKNELNRSRIKQLQKKVAHSQKRSNNRQKKRLALQREWQRTTERERNTLHRITSDLVKTYGASFYIEDLQINNMVKNRNLSRSIIEQQWGTFIELLTYKAEEAGGFVKKVNPRNTSKTCNQCGCIQDMPLSKRTYHCSECGHEDDRDINAAKNILRVGLDSDSPGGIHPRHVGSILDTQGMGCHDHHIEQYR